MNALVFIPISQSHDISVLNGSIEEKSAGTSWPVGRDCRSGGLGRRPELDGRGQESAAVGSVDGRRTEADGRKC